MDAVAPRAKQGEVSAKVEGVDTLAPQADATMEADAEQVQENVRRLAQLNAIRGRFDDFAKESEGRVGRMTSQMAPEGRERERIATGVASRLADDAPRVGGGLNTASAKVYDVVEENGKKVTRYVLPDGSLTTNVGLADMSERYMSLRDKMRNSIELNAIAQQVGETAKKVDAAVANSGKMFTAEGVIGARQTRKERRLNMSTGKLEDVYITPLGNEYNNQFMADMESFRYRMDTDMSAGAQLRRAYRRRNEIEAKLEKRGAELYEDYKAAESDKGFLQEMGEAMAADRAGGGGMNSIDESPVYTDDREYQALRLASRQLDEQIQQLENYVEKEKHGERFWHDFGRGLWQGVSSIDFWDFGKNAARDAITSARIASQQNSGAELNEAEQEALYETYLTDNVMSEFGDLGTGAKWGGIASTSLSFAKDFLITGGGFSSLTTKLPQKAATEIATKAASKLSIDAAKSLGMKVAKEGLFKTIRTGGKGVVKKLLAEQGLTNAARIVAVRSLGVTAEDLLIRAPLLTATIQGQNLTADIINTKLGPVVVDAETGELRFADDKSWGEAIWEASADKVIENFSEMSGARMIGAADVAKAFGARNLTAALLRSTRPGAGTVLSKSSEFLGKMGINGYFGEVGEEYYGQLWRTMLNLDSAKDGEGNNLFGSGEFHADIWGGTAMTIGLTGGVTIGGQYAVKGGKKGVDGIRYIQLKHLLNKSDAKASEVFIPEVWDNLRTTIDAMDNIEMCELAVQVANDPRLTEEQRIAQMEYMERAMVMRGHNLGEYARKRTGASVSVVDEELSQSYIDGYNIVGQQELTDAQNMYDLQRDRVVERFGEGIIRAVDADETTVLENYGEDAESREMLLDYMHARMVYNGMMQRVTHDIDMLVERNNAIIRSRTNKATGMVEPAMMKEGDRQVYVVNGRVTISEDGGIDIDASDESLIVKDAETGELEQVSPNAILSMGATIDPNEEMRTSAAVVREQHAQEALKRIKGIATFNVGETYTVAIDDFEVSVEIVANEEGVVDNGDGTVNVSINGSEVTPLSKELIQQSVDAANLARVIEYERKRGEAVSMFEGAEGADNSYKSDETYKSNNVEGVDSFASQADAMHSADEVQSAEGGVAPIGKGAFGNIFNSFKGKAMEAVAFLFRRKEGEAQGVFHRDEIGDIGFIYGNERNGLAHIIRKHIIEQSDYNSVGELTATIQDVVENGDIIIQKGGNYKIEKAGHRVVVAKNTEGNFVITAYDNTRSATEKKRSEADATLFDQRVREELDGTLVPTDLTPNDKGSNQSSDLQGVDEKRVESAVGRDCSPSDVLVMKDAEGNVVRGEIVDYDAADDAFVVDVDRPINGKYSPQLSRGELEGMVVQHNGVAVERKRDTPTEEIGAEVGDNRNDLVSLQTEVENNGISERISQRDDGAQDGEDSEISRVLAVINSARASSNSGEGSAIGEGASSRGGSAVSGQEVEQRAVEAYAKEAGLWMPMGKVFDLGQIGPSGTENETYIAEDGGSIFKVNNLMNSRGEISRLLDKIALHNKYFPETAYELTGFTGFDGRSVYPILRQSLVKDATNTTPEEIDEYMRSLGFEQTGEASYSNGAVTISDLRPRNVLKDSDGDIYVVDAEFARVEEKSYKSDEAYKSDNAEGVGALTPRTNAAEGTVKVEGEDAVASRADARKSERSLSAVERVPKDARGELLYEKVDADTAWDAIVEQTDGDAEMAQAVASSMLADKEAALRKAERAKTKGGATIAEKIVAEKERKAMIDAAREELEAWKRIADTTNRRKQAAERERERQVAAEAARQRAEEERVRAEREEAARKEREALNGVPDMINDTPQDARARGYRRVSGHKVDRQGPLQGLQGRAVDIEFATKVHPTARVTIIEAKDLQPSHYEGQRNPYHFLDEAQPKERKDDDSKQSARYIAENMDARKMTTSLTAFTGAPTVNARGEAIQGNNRSAALRIMWESHPSSRRGIRII